MEALPDYAGDFICYGVLDGADSAYVDDSQLWKNLPAVKAGRLMPYEQVAFMHRDPITLTNQLEIFTDFFRAHADAAAQRGRFVSRLRTSIFLIGSRRGRAGRGALPVLRQHPHSARPGAGGALLAGYGESGARGHPELRGPRTVGCILVGAAFAVAGAVMQGVTRNPLADSGLLGINAGAAFALALCYCYCRV